MIRVQEEPFDIADCLAELRGGRTSIGGIAIFIGSVRDLSDGRAVSSMTLEHYPGMTEQALCAIEREARERWPIDDCLIVHRFGTLKAGDDIVLVMTVSAHREAAFQACAFLMDWLKTKAPFWKLESDGSDARWVDAKASDDAAADRWKN